MPNLNAFARELDKLYSKYVIKEKIHTRVVDADKQNQTKDEYLRSRGLENEQVLLVTIRV